MSAEQIKRLADEYAHCYAFVGDATMPLKRAELHAAIDAHPINAAAQEPVESASPGRQADSPVAAAPNEPAARLLPADCPICRGTGREGIPGARCFACDGTGTFMRGLAERASPQAVPAGLKLVPIDPTPTMWNAAVNTPGIKSVNDLIASRAPRHNLWDNANPPLMQAWRAMLAAAPQAAPVEKAMIDAITTGTGYYAAPQAVDAPVALRDALADVRIEALKIAIEGECDGLAINDSQARSILQYLFEQDGWAALSQERPNEGGTDV